MLVNASVQSAQISFETLNLINPICRAVHEEKYTLPTPIQKKAIPHLVQGRDLLGCAQTGTGKTAAFALPILQWLEQNSEVAGPKGVRTLILVPTRELAAQISESFRIYGRYLKIKQAVVYGGVRPTLQIRAYRAVLIFWLPLREGFWIFLTRDSCVWIRLVCLSWMRQTECWIWDFSQTLKKYVRRFHQIDRPCYFQRHSRAK